MELTARAWVIGGVLLLVGLAAGFAAGWRSERSAPATILAVLSAALGFAVLGLPTGDGGENAETIALLLTVYVLPPFCGVFIGWGVGGFARWWRNEG